MIVNTLKDIRPFPSLTRSWQQQLLPRCTYVRCPGKHPVLNGFLRRGEGIHCNGNAWYCSPECMQSALTDHFAQIAFSRPAKPGTPRIPLGLELISRGIITSEQLRIGLQRQAERGGLLGEALKELGFVTDDQITAAVASQWSCPLFPVQGIQATCAVLFPLSLLRAYQMLPVHSVPSTRTLFVAFSRGVDHNALYAIETMLSLRTEACIVSTNTLSSTLNRFAEYASRNEVTVEFPISAPEMATMVTGYAQQLRSDHLRYAVCNQHLWVQIAGAKLNVPLVFKLPEQDQP